MAAPALPIVSAIQDIVLKIHACPLAPPPMSLDSTKMDANAVSTRNASLPTASTVPASPLVLVTSWINRHRRMGRTRTSASARMGRNASPTTALITPASPTAT